MRRADLSACRLYGIIDLGYVAADDAEHVAAEFLKGGVDIIQLRAKTQTLPIVTKLAAALHRVIRDANVPFIINDHPEIAADLGLEGVHVGQNDLSIAEVRAIAGANCLVGRSTHSVEQAQRAAQEGSDYIGFGPLFATPTKPDYLPIGLDEIGKVHTLVSLPIFCIGGIKLENLSEVLAAGAERVVIVSGLLKAADIAEYARAAKALLNQTSNVKPQT